MKYIRTNAFEEEEIINVSNWEYEDGVYFTDKYAIFETEILNQADTIEGLCDCWVIIPRGATCNPFVRNIKENIDHFKNDSHIIYAAIWTIGEKGQPILNSVAKLNDEKGELELL